MENNRIAKYFKQKSHTALLVTAVVLAVIGFCLVWFFSLWAPGLFVMFIGVVLGLTFSLQIKDAELDEAAREFTESFQKIFEEKFIYDDVRKFHQGELNGVQAKKAVFIPGYLLKGENLLIRKGDDGKLRSSVYQSLGIVVEDHNICIGVQTMNLIDKRYVAPRLENWQYRELSRAELYDPIDVHTTNMRIFGADGEELIHFQVPADAQADELVATINARAQKAAESL